MDTSTVWQQLPQEYVETIAAIVFLVIVGKTTRSESRLSMMAIAAAIVYPYPVTLWSIGLLGVFLRVVDYINIPLGER